MSTTDQDPALQLDALNEVGADRVFTDHGISGSAAQRPALDRCLDQLRHGDTLVVWRLDRLARSLRHLLDLVEQLAGRGVYLRSLTEQIDTSSASGRLVLSVFGALAEFERELIKERTAAGLAAARTRGARIGRPSRLEGAALDQARALVASGHRVCDVARTLGVGRSTLYRVLDQVGP